MGGERFDIEAIGRVVSPLADRLNAPRQADEGAPAARIVIDARYHAALDGLSVGDRIQVLTWLHESDRATQRVHPRGDTSRPAMGVFATRSPDRPNPIGIHEVTISELHEDGFGVHHLEAIDGTPVIDIKPELCPPADR